MAIFRDKMVFAGGALKKDESAPVTVAITNLDATIAASATPAFDCNSAVLATTNDHIGNLYKILMDAGLVNGTVTTV